jgi:hypothetical protein
MTLKEANDDIANRRVHLAEFGPGVIRKAYEHPETGEIVADIKAQSGEDLHVSLAYARRLLAV